MPVIRWIVKHLVIVSVGVLVAFGFVYKDELETELTQLGVTETVKTYVADASAFLDKIKPQPAPAPKVEVAEVAVDPEPVAEVVVAAVKPAPRAPQESAAPVAQNQPGQMPTHLSIEVPAQAPALAPRPYVRNSQPQQGYHGRPPAYAPQMPRMPQMQQMHQMQQPPMPTPMVPQAQASAPAPRPAVAVLGDAEKAEWMAARAAFWKRDIAKAETLYKALFDTTDVADVAGELGNIYFMQRRYAEAGEMFYQAGLRHLKGATPMRVGMVMGPLSQIAPQKAQDLQKQIMAFQMAQHQARMQATAPQKPQ